MLITTDFDVIANGIVLLDRDVLHATLGWTPQPHDARDLMNAFFTSDLGDLVIEQGAVVPLLSIDEGGYELICRLSSVPSEVEPLVVTRNGRFPLRVASRAHFHTLEHLMHWPADCVGMDAGLAAGCYAVTVNGFRQVEAGEIVRAGYEFVCEPVAAPIASSAEMAKAMRIFF